MVRKNGEKFSSFLLRIFLFTFRVFLLAPLPRIKMPFVLAVLILTLSSIWRYMGFCQDPRMKNS